MYLNTHMLQNISWKCWTMRFSRGSYSPPPPAAMVLPSEHTHMLQNVSWKFWTLRFSRGSYSPPPPPQLQWCSHPSSQTKRKLRPKSPINYRTFMFRLNAHDRRCRSSTTPAKRSGAQPASEYTMPCVSKLFLGDLFMDHLIHIIYLPHASLIYISVIFGKSDRK